MKRIMSNTKRKIFLGIETSCDDTAVALIDAEEKSVLKHCIHQQIEHQSFGGVVPDLAFKGHAKHLPNLLNTLLKSACVDKEEIEGIGVTAGPGLAGGLLVGVMFAKGVSIALKKPLWAINHLQAHALVARLCCDLEFPYLALLFSGGHCEFVVVYSATEFYLLGYGLDDAAGECLDKVGRRLGFSFPAGAAIEVAAKMGDPLSVPLPIPMRDKSLNFSFSGLKSAALRWINAEGEKKLSFEKKANLCASLQYAIGQGIQKKIENFFDNLPSKSNPRVAVFCGGVAANQYLRNVLEECFLQYDVRLFTPPPKFCTDNGMMIAWNAYEKYRAGILPSMNFSIRARWPIGI
ncbi:tRNA (adenosine(37)-N6)-threonylcarbamoyltransferase complex transferase subunit TsaD [Holospora undulata]|uniref:tRNA N6-adenosine threonylcarbamoyltransferase n=2 Tax=Holospora TaxID=44747 RepID=A0A061JH93_9PROT|nr:tRNA (adenosine(37)-N6)-threonylcarbamoyltransferase complex transferase subunit TsaD [Holospora undulata]ETZ04583.1 tRNA N6-adenosine threonylcarbamoyltransferase [Holospora undulata HU1]